MICNIYGRVILKNTVTGPAPSICAASYVAVGTFIKIPEQMSIEYGTPTHVLTRSMAMRVSGMEKPNRKLMPIFKSHSVIMPLSASIILESNKSEINCGTAMVETNTVRKNFLPRIPFFWIKMANSIPIK